MSRHIRSADAGTALAGLLIALAVYSATARHLPGLPSGLDVVFHAVVVFPAFAAAIWLALPLARERTVRLLVFAVAAGGLALVLTLLGVDSVANVAKLACYALVGFCFLTLFEELWWIALVAVLVPWVDVWSVAAGRRSTSSRNVPASSSASPSGSRRRARRQP